MRIAPFQPSDRDSVIRLHEGVYKEMNLTSFLWKPCQQIESLEMACAKYVYRDAVVKGYAAAYSLDETHFRLNLIVDPRHAKQGIGTLLLDEIESEIRKQGGIYLQARVLDKMAESLRFALSKGFIEIHRMHGMSLRAEDFSYERWKYLGEELSRQGFSVTTFKAEEEINNAPIDKLAELQRHAREGWPSPDPTWNLEATADGLRSAFKNIGVPERFSIMKFKEEYVAYTSADRKNLVGTGVHPRYRGRGIATYLKASDLKRCIDAGQEYFESSSANPAMLRVNQKLGYKFNELTEVRFVKHLSGAQG